MNDSCIVWHRYQLIEHWKERGYPFLVATYDDGNTALEAAATLEESPMSDGATYEVKEVRA